jgi:O-antigen ligase
VGSKDGGTAILGAFACLAMGVGLLMTKSRSGIACLALATVMAGAVVYRRQRQAHARALVAATFSIFLLGTIAWAGVDNLVFKFRSPDQGLAATAGRLSAWTDTLAIIRASPLTGTGFNTYGTSMQVYQTSPHTTLFQEAHNDYLQLAAEGGLLVGIPILCTLGVFIVLVQRRFREAPHDGTTYWLRVGAVVGLAAIALQSLVEFSLQMPGNAALFAVLAAIALHRSPRLRAIKRT